MRKSRGLVEHFLLSLLSKLTVLSSGQSCAASSSVRHLMKIGLTLSKALLNDDEADPAFVGITAECLLLNIEVIVRHFPGHLVKFLETIGEHGLCSRGIHCWASGHSQGFEEKNLGSSPGLLGQ